MLSGGERAGLSGFVRWGGGGGGRRCGPVLTPRSPDFVEEPSGVGSAATASLAVKP